MAIRWSIINGDFISRGIFRLKYAKLLIVCIFIVAIFVTEERSVYESV